MTYYVYILYSISHDRFYIGQSAKLQYRLYQHNAGKVASTKGYRPWIIGHTEEFTKRTDAIKRESFLKSPAGWIELLAIKKKINVNILIQ